MEQEAVEETQTGQTAVQDMTEASEEAAAISQYYVVQRGDTLRSICMSVYGNYDRVAEVCAQNGIINPDSILYGQTLLLP